MSDFEHKVIVKITELDRLEDEMRVKNQEDEQKVQEFLRVQEKATLLGQQVVKLLVDREVRPLPIEELVEGTGGRNPKFQNLGSGWHICTSHRKPDFEGFTRVDTYGIDIDGNLLTAFSDQTLIDDRHRIRGATVHSRRDQGYIDIIESEGLITGLACLIRFGRPFDYPD